jgi:hypothetical protein
LRSSCAAAALSGAVQAPQKLKPSGFSWPHRGQTSTPQDYGDDSHTTR